MLNKRKYYIVVLITLLLGIVTTSSASGHPTEPSDALRLAAFQIPLQNNTVSYSGTFNNPQWGSGTVAINLTFNTNTVSGYIDFDNYPGGSALCGAGDFSGTRSGTSVSFTFVSRDPDTGCSWDTGQYTFTVNLTLSSNYQSLSGSYSISNGQGGTFNASGTPNFVVSGQVTNSASGNGLTGVTISDGAGHSATTNSNGAYTLSGLNGGSFTITPSRSGYIFLPTSLAVSVPPDVTNRNFVGATGTYISGRVTNQSGNPVANMAIIVQRTNYYRVIYTNSNGNYIIGGLNAGYYLVRPSTSSYRLYPTARTVLVPPSATNQNFTATPLYGTLTGRVTSQTTGGGIANARVSAGGVVRYTNGSGYYTLPNILPGSHALYVSAGGYHNYQGSVAITANSTTTRNVSLTPIRVDGYRLPYPGGRTYMCTQGNGGPYSHFGSWYYAFDFGMPNDSQVVASRAGRVVVIKTGGYNCRVAANWCYNNASYVRIRHADNTDTLYWHLRRPLVSVGQWVQSGQAIALSDNTGYSTGPHLDFTRHNAGGWWSIPVSFLDVPGGIPQRGGWYRSDNYVSATEFGPFAEPEDTTPPVGSVQIRLTGQPTYTLRLEAADYVTDTIEMRLAGSEDELTTATWEPFADTVEWSALEAYVQYRDPTGNTSEVYSDTLEAIVYEPIQASFAVSPTVCVGAELSLENQTTPLCEQCGWDWDFGNGATSQEMEPYFDYTGQNSFYGYAEPGTYTIELIVANIDSVDSATQQVEALSGPSANFTMTRSGLTISVEAEETDAISWAWDFGDGATATGRTATHTYTSTEVTALSPAVELVVEKDNECTSISHQYIPTFKTYLPLIIKQN